VSPGTATITLSGDPTPYLGTALSKITVVVQ
jgi:hypothetical protein